MSIMDARDVVASLRRSRRSMLMRSPSLFRLRLRQISAKETKIAPQMQFKEGILITGEEEEMTAWVKKVEYRVETLQGLYVRNFERLKDLKRVYELHWFKNN